MWFSEKNDAVDIAQDRQDNLGGTCIARSSCNQMVVGRELRYGRALAIIQSEEYLNVIDTDLLRRNDRVRRAKTESKQPK